MSGSYGIDPITGDFTVEYGSRVTTTTEGTLICLTPTLQTFTKTVDFIDPPKEIAYIYVVQKSRSTQNVGGTITYGAEDQQTCQTFFNRQPYEQTVEQTLMTAPAGADIFVGQLKLVRTIAPTHTWFNATIGVKQKENLWIPWNGSAIIEAALGLVRGIHLYIKPNANPALPGTLVLQNQQSVMGKAGGYHDAGADIYVWPPSGSSRGDYTLLPTSIPSLPVWTSTVSPYRKVRVTQQSSTIGMPYPGPATAFFDMERGRSQQCSVTDPTNYRSVYTVDVRGWFGKRSVAA